MSIRCQSKGCSKFVEAGLTESHARAIGWMVWAGETIGGSNTTVRFCPVHAGHTDEAAEAQETGFDARCYTCNETASEASDFEGTEEAAEEWIEEHVCESDVSVVRPKVGASL